MVPSAIYFKSSGIISSQFFSVQGQYLELHRQLDGSFRMEALIALLSLLQAVFPCKIFLSFTTHLGSIYLFLFVEFSSHL